MILITTLFIGYIAWLINQDQGKEVLKFQYSSKDGEHLLQPSFNGEYFVTSEQKQNGLYNILVRKTSSNEQVGEFEVASHNFVGEVIWFQDNNRFLYRSSEALYTYDLKNNKIDELQGVGGGSTQISPNEDIITVVDRNELLVFSLDSGEINERIRFPEYQKPKSIVSWDESGFPLLIASYQEGAGFSLFKMRNNRSVNNLDITISSDWNSPNPWYEQVDNYVYMKDNNTLLYFDLEKENFYEVGDFNQIMTVSPGRTKVGGYSNGPVVHNLDPIEKRLYESSHSEADPYLWKWLDDDSFVIVERQLYLSGFMGDRSLLEVHNVSEGSSIISMEIPRPLFNNVYWAEEARQIFVQSAENEILVYDVVQ